MTSALTPSPSQQRAIEAPAGPLLVLAGPGAGKTFCLIERIHFLVGNFGIDPGRICAFTFTNKAAGEITHRLEVRLGDAASQIKGGTIHAFCADLLRKHGSAVGLDQGFGIADEQYQLSTLARIEGPRRWHRSVLNRFSAHRFRGDALQHNDLVLLDAYERHLATRNVLDFDMLVVRAASLLEHSEAGAEVRGAYDVILVDEFQDLNPVQYRVVAALAREHRHVFAVGDDEQSIYSWAGADPTVFTDFVNDFQLSAPIHLEENRRCPAEVFALARKLISINTPIFADRVPATASRTSEYPVRAITFATDDEECDWIVQDVRSDRDKNHHPWGDIAVLYRKHDIGDRLESSFLNAGIPCRLPRGHALSDDPAVAYVIAAARVISAPDDEYFREELFRAVLPAPLFDEALARAREAGISLARQLGQMTSALPRADENARQMRRALYDLRNLRATGKTQTTLAGLVQELLSRRVGPLRSALDDNHDAITDPESHPEVVALAEQLRKARQLNLDVFIAPMQGVDVALKGMLRAIGIRAVRGVDRPPGAVCSIDAQPEGNLEVPLVVFKAAQLLEMDVLASTFTNFTAIDVETTGRNAMTAEIVEIAAVRVRDGRITDQYSALVKPRSPISAGAAATHHITNEEVANAPDFAEVWPVFRDFCGGDIVVAHNGYAFDFRIIDRQVRALGESSNLLTFDTLPLARELFPTSRKLVDLARQFGIDTGKAHRALDDTITLAKLLLELGRMKQARSRKTALVSLLDHLGVALALASRNGLGEEATLFHRFSRYFSLGKYTDCLEFYEREQGSDASFPTVDEVIELLGGTALMQTIRAEKTADERYPAAMLRLRRLIAEVRDAPLEEQITEFLERIALSKWDGLEPEQGKVNLLTLHSTKGLEFSRVYIVGAEDDQLPGSPPKSGPKPQEIEEARRLLYVGMTRTKDRLILTRCEVRADRETGGHRFLDEMHLTPEWSAGISAPGNHLLQGESEE